MNPEEFSRHKMVVTSRSRVPEKPKYFNLLIINLSRDSNDFVLKILAQKESIIDNDLTTVANRKRNYYR